MEPLVLHPQQEDAVWKIASEPTRAALCTAGTGAGKTVVAAEVMKMVNPSVALIVAPPNTRLGWKVTLERQGATLPFKPLDSSKQGKVNVDDWMMGVPGVYFVGTQLFTRWAYKKNKSTGGKMHTDLWWKREPDMMVFDESHYAQSAKSATFKALQQIAPKFRMCMSATFYGNSFEGAWSTTSWLWPDLVDANKWLWADKWCKTEFDPFSYSKKKVVGEKNPGAYLDWLPCVVDFTPPLNVESTEDTVYVELGARQRRVYEKAAEDYILWLQDEASATGQSPLTITAPIAVTARLRQAVLGELTLVGDDEVMFADDCKSPKLDAVVETLSGEFAGESALILTDSRKFAEVAVKRIAEATGERTELWSGGTSMRRREEIKQDFVAGGVKYLVAVYSALGAGVDQIQHATRNVLRINRPMGDSVLEEQVMGRVIRQGQKHTVRVVTLEAVDTVDTDGYASLQEKAAQRMKSLRKG